MAVDVDDDDDPTSERAESDGFEGSVAAALLEQWQVGNDAAVYRVLAVDIAPRLISHLRTAFRLQDADCQDCLSAAYDRFQPAVRARKVLANPYAYFFKIGINAALELLRERKAELLHPSVDIEAAGASYDADADAFGAVDDGAGTPDPPVRVVMELVEDAVSELEVEEFWAVEVVRIAVERLSPGLRRVAQAVMYKDLAFEAGGAADFDYPAQEAGPDLGMTAGAFRTAKHRAYAAVRDAVPALIVELGLEPPERAEAAIFPDGRGRFLAEDAGP